MKHIAIFMALSFAALAQQPPEEDERFARAAAQTNPEPVQRLGGPRDA
jgi:hypothetical protein